MIRRISYLLNLIVFIRPSTGRGQFYSGKPDMLSDVLSNAFPLKTDVKVIFLTLESKSNSLPKI